MDYTLAVPVDYTLSVPMYVVTLPCNHEFRSLTRVTTNETDADAFVITGEDDPEDITWLYCRTCRKDYAVQAWELEEYQDEPRDEFRSEQFPNGRRLGEKRLQRMYDEAVVKTRIAAVLLKTQGSVSLPDVAANGGWSLRTTERVAKDLRDLRKFPTEEEIKAAADAETDA